MNKAKRYSDEGRLNYKKVFAVVIAIVVLIMAVVMIKKLLTKAENTSTTELNYYALYEDEKWGVVGTNGKKIIEPMYQEMIIIVNKSKDVFLCTYDINEESGEYKTKVINSKNEEIFTTYEKVEALDNYDENSNIWYESDVLKVEKNGKWGLINIDGKEILAPEYDSIQTIKGIKNSLLVEQEGIYGLVNDKGVKILDVNYSDITSFGDDYQDGYITVDVEGKYGIVNFSGEQILENKYEKIEQINSDKYFVIQEASKQKLIDKEGNVIIDKGFDEIKQIATSGIVYTSSNKYGLMSFDKQDLINAEYEELREINNDIFSAKKNGKYGIIDLNNQEKIPFEYTNSYYDKKAGIYILEDENYNSKVLDTDFNIKLEGILSEIDTDSGYMKVKINDEYKYYNFKFEEKSPYDLFINNTLFVSKKDGKYGLVNSKQEVVVDYIYDDMVEQNKYGYVAVKKDGLWGSIDSKGNVVIEPTYDLDNYLLIDFIGQWHLGLDLNMNYYCEN